MDHSLGKDLIKVLNHDHGLSCRTLEKRLGISRSYISKILNEGKPKNKKTDQDQTEVAKLIQMVKQSLMPDRVEWELEEISSLLKALTKIRRFFKQKEIKQQSKS